jgi:hypothetical protein
VDLPPYSSGLHLTVIHQGFVISSFGLAGARGLRTPAG